MAPNVAPSLAGAAVWYAERGHLVFPLRPGQKIPATPNGFKDASMNPDTIRNWWRAEPRYNIGLSTGHLFDVIDLDGPDGITSIAAIEDEGLLPTIIGRVLTPGDEREQRPPGMHLLVRPTGDGCATKIRPGIDYRGIGGYVVAPPSLINGVPYRWTQPMA
jgi:hypothetical protein